MSSDESSREEWYRFLTEGEKLPRYARRFHGLLPSSPRCKLCASPFNGLGGALMRTTGRQRSRFNPQFCVKCQQFEHPGGAEINLTMIFADVRGSTTLAERMSPSEFTRLINRFYVVATDILVRSDGLVDRLMGDEVVGLFVPGFAGPSHARRAVDAAKALLYATGHAHPSGPWIPVGVGINTGAAFVGVVGGEAGTPQDFTALGDNVNATARLAANAGQGEILVSQAAADDAGLAVEHLESRDLQLKGKSSPFRTYVITITAA